MKKFRTWRSSTRSTRSQTQKRKEEALLERAMGSHPSDTSVHKPKVLWVFINDSTDSDNHAAALVWAKFLVKHRYLKGIYIAEPRHVDLGYYTTSEEFKQILSLVDSLRPKPPGDDEAIKTVLAGKLTQHDIDISTIDDSTPAGRPLNEDERMLLQRCIKPDKNKKELKVAKKDAIQHAKLLVMDFLSTMKADADAEFETYIDHKCLDGALKRPINLKTHYHEELVFRNAQELYEFRDVTRNNELSLSDKAQKLREWYTKSIERKLSELENNQEPWRDLKDYQPLFEQMKQYERVIVFGGCSLSILQELLQYDDSLSKKVEYYQQGGTFNPKLNILGNPLNFALNLGAAEFVFEHAQKLSKFRLIPTDTTKKLEYTLVGLTKWSAPIGLHSLGFYGKVDIWDLIAKEEEEKSPCANTQEIIRWRSKLVSTHEEYTSPNFRAYKVVMADLSAYLISFTDAFKEYQTLEGVVSSREIGVTSITDGEKMQLKPDEASSIKALWLDLPKDLKVVLVKDSLSLINDTIQTGSSSFKEFSGPGERNTT